MKIIAGVLVMLVLPLAVLAQLGTNPVNWQFSVIKIDQKNYELTCTAYIQNPWHIYPQEIRKGVGQATHIIINPNPVILIGDTTMEVGKMIEKNVLGMKLKFYQQKVSFILPVKLKAIVRTNITGVVKYMACTDEKCLPPAETNFNIMLGGK